MSCRIAILGNSHAACLKTALVGEPGLLGSAHVDFFAAPRSHLRELRVSGTALVPETNRLRQHLEASSRGNGTIELSVYDVILLAGLRFEIFPVEQCLSSAVSSLVAQSMVQDNVAWSLARAIRTICRLPIYLLPEPLYAWPADRAEGRYDTSLAYDDILSACQRHADELELQLIGQPAETRIFNLSSRQEYNRADEEDGATVPDIKHLNGQYGRVVMRVFRQRLEQDRMPVAHARKAAKAR